MQAVQAGRVDDGGGGLGGVPAGRAARDHAGQGARPRLPRPHRLPPPTLTHAHSLLPCSRHAGRGAPAPLPALPCPRPRAPPQPSGSLAPRPPSPAPHPPAHTHTTHTRVHTLTHPPGPTHPDPPPPPARPTLRLAMFPAASSISAKRHQWSTWPARMVMAVGGRACMHACSEPKMVVASDRPCSGTLDGRQAGAHAPVD